MHRRSSPPGNLWIAGILSAIFFCLALAFGGSGGSWQIATPNGVPPARSSGGSDVSHQSSTRFLANSNRHAVLPAPKGDKGLGLDHGGGLDPAILPGEVVLPASFSEKQFITVVQHEPNGGATSDYNARAPPALI
jgi:hypothetical protein